MNKKKKKRGGKNPGSFQSPQREKQRLITKRELADAFGDKVNTEGMRLNKYIAHCGICSRRQAADYVKAGKVKVNDAVVKKPYYQIQKGDIVKYDDKVVQPESRRVYLLINKPKNVITTTSDERNRTTVLDIIGEEVGERIFPVGRLDRDTTGLLLLTNDGQLSQRLAHPSKQVKKIYHVTLDKPVTEEHLHDIAKGLKLEDGIASVDKVAWKSPKATEEVLIDIHIGKNRIVRRIFEHLGYEVKRLDRVYYAGLTKKDLPRGRFRFLSEREIIMLKHFS